MRALLLLIDLQNDFLEAAALEPARPDVIRRAARLLAAARDADVPVIHCVTSVDPDRDDRMPHWKAAGRWSCVRGSRGHAAPAELAPRAGEKIVEKTFFSGFSAEALAAAIAEARADTVVLAGVHLHGCIRATALDAYAAGLDAWIAEDATASDDPLHAAVTRRYLDGRAARFATVEELAARFRGGFADGSSSVDAERLPPAVVAGRPIDAAHLPCAPHRSPRDTSRVLFSVARAGAREAALASAAAREGARGWSAAASSRRTAVLLVLADRLEGESDSLAREMAVDVGKPVGQGSAEVRRAAELVRRAAASAGAGAGLVPCGPHSASRRVPVGVVAAITPWNNPVGIPWGKLAPALALGNAAVWKPAPAATRIALRTLQLARDAGLPDSLINLVAGDHRTAAAVMADPGIDAVSLSGSSLAGWAAQEACARRRIPLQAELGGNNCAIVWSGADLPRAAIDIARGAFAFAGQRCTANRRVVVESAMHDGLLELLAAAAAELSWGDPLDPTTDVGPLVSVDARDRVLASLGRAEATDARVLRPHASRESAAALEALEGLGAYCVPAIVSGASHDSEIVQEETFGPVLVVESARTFEEALALADGVRQGLAASLFAGDGPWREHFLTAARAGILKWNSSTADADGAAPFGGWKASGLGPPEHGPGNAEFYGRLQAVYGLGPERVANEVEA